MSVLNARPHWQTELKTSTTQSMWSVAHLVLVTHNASRPWALAWFFWYQSQRRRYSRAPRREAAGERRSEALQETTSVPDFYQHALVSRPYFRYDAVDSQWKTDPERSASKSWIIDLVMIP